MPLTDRQLKQWASTGGITPYTESLVNPASVDLRIGNHWKLQGSDKLHSAYTITLYPNTVYVQLYNALFPKKKPTLLMGITYEKINIPENMAACLKLKTTPTRKGLGQIIGDWIDPGYEGHLTLMFYAHKPFTFNYGDRICQIVLERLDDDVEKSYKKIGHYLNQRLPTGAWDEEYKWDKLYNNIIGREDDR